MQMYGPRQGSRTPESFAPIDLKFWHNIFEMLNFKKVWKKNRFSESAYPLPSPPPLNSKFTFSISLIPLNNFHLIQLSSIPLFRYFGIAFQ